MRRAVGVVTSVPNKIAAAPAAISIADFRERSERSGCFQSIPALGSPCPSTGNTEAGLACRCCGATAGGGSHEYPGRMVAGGRICCCASRTSTAVPLGPHNASTNSFADPYLSCGSRCSARDSAVSTQPGKPALKSDAFGGGSVNRLTKPSLPANGGLPASISKIIAPSA